MISDTLSKLESLKKERNAVIFAHYYQDSAVQDVADFAGDNLALAQYAVETIEKMVAALHTMSPKIILSKDYQLKALAPLEKILVLS